MVSMDRLNDKPRPSQPASRITPLGLVFLLTTSLGWGFNWPVTKYLLTEVPPLTMRGATGLLGALLLSAIALLFGQSLKVERALWPRLWLYSFLNVSCWMTLMVFALFWLSAGETAMVAYTMPVWASLLAWPILGERPTFLRVAALIIAFGGLGALLGGGSIALSVERLAGYLMVLVAAFAFALGAVLSKRKPLPLPPLSAAAWQVGLGCLPLGVVGFLIETTDVSRISTLGWWLLTYGTVVQFCIAYVTWFAALARLPASVATIGTMLTPVAGVVAGSLALGEPLGAVQIVALLCILAGVGLAIKS